MVHMRTVVEDELKRRNMLPTNTSLREVATSMRQELGEAIMAERSIPKVQHALKESDLVIINSVKAMAEADLYRKELGGRFVLLAVYASPRTRFERLSHRGLKWDMNDYGSLVWRDKKELEWGLGNAISLADYTIINEGTIEELGQSVERFIAFLDVMNGK